MATVPNEITYSAGSVLTAAQLNTNLRDAINFVITNRPILEVRQTSVQSISGATSTAINFDAEDIDNDGMHSTSSNTSRATAQTAGRYRVGGGISWAGNGAGRRNCQWAINGAVQNGVDAGIAAGGNTNALPVAARSMTLHLNVGDYLELLGFQDCGGSLNTAVTTSQQPGMSVEWIGTT